mgnify:FL=1
MLTWEKWSGEFSLEVGRKVDYKGIRLIRLAGEFSLEGGRMDNDMDSFIITINNGRPLELDRLSRGMIAISNVYARFNNRNEEAKLLIKEVRHGSIILELISLINSSPVPLISSVNNLIQFAGYMKQIISFGKDEKDIKTEEGYPVPSSEDYKDTVKITNLLDVDTRNSFGSHAVSSGNTYYNCTFNGSEAVAIREKLNSMTNTGMHSMNKQLFYWRETGFYSNNKDRGNKGLIENICRNPVRVIFDNDYDKEYMTSGEDWHQNLYTVDVEIQTKDDKPLRYRITRVYREETFKV